MWRRSVEKSEAMFVAVSEALTPCETQIDLLLIKNVVFSTVGVKCSTDRIIHRFQIQLIVIIRI